MAFAVKSGPRPVRRILTALSLLGFGLVACSFAPLRIPVDDVVLPAGSSGGDVCYVRVDRSSPASFRQASYEATAIYEAAALIGEPQSVTVRVYGRRSAPAGHEGQDSFCVEVSNDDTPLSDELELEPDEPKSIVVGGEYGEELASLIRRQPFFIGASLSGGGLLESNQRITLTGGVVIVHF